PDVECRRPRSSSGTAEPSTGLSVSVHTQPQCRRMATHGEDRGHSPPAANRIHVLTNQQPRQTTHKGDIMATICTPARRTSRSTQLALLGFVSALTTIITAVHPSAAEAVPCNLTGPTCVPAPPPASTGLVATN